MASPRGRRLANILNPDKNCCHNLVSPLESGIFVYKQQKMNCKGPSISDVIQENYLGFAYIMGGFLTKKYF